MFQCIDGCVLTLLSRSSLSIFSVKVNVFVARFFRSYSREKLVASFRTLVMFLLKKPF